MTRRPDWAARLAALLRVAEQRSFDARHWNCATFAITAVEAVTGGWPLFRVLPTLEASADSAGFPRIAPAFARAGDVVLVRTPEERLGVVVDGGRAAFLAPHGLLHQPMDARIAVAWRIG